MTALSFPPNIADIHTQMLNTGFQAPDLGAVNNNQAMSQTAYDRIAIWNNPQHPSHDPLELSDAGVTPDQFNDMASSLQNHQNVCVDMRTHMQGVPNALPGAPGSLGTTNMVKNLGTMQMHRTMSDTMGTSLSSNPCLPMQEIMGTLTGAAAPLFEAANSALTGILSVIGQGIAAVVSALGTTIAAALVALDDATGGMLSTIAEEIGNFAKAVAEAIGFAQSAGLASLYNDPCTQAIMAATAPPELKKTLDAAVVYLET